MNSDARIFFARVYICFSPVESPFSISRRARLRTTSASSKTSPVLIFSRLYLKRQVQPREDQDRRRLRARRGRPQPGPARDGEGTLHRREADVHAGEEDPRVGV